MTRHVHDVRRQYLDFLAEKSSRSCHLRDSILKIYVRKSVRVIQAGPQIIGRCIDIGSVDYTVPNPDRTTPMRRGNYGAFLQFVEEHNPYDAIYAECVLSERAREILVKNGYTTSPSDPASFVKITNKRLIGYPTMMDAYASIHQSRDVA